MDPETYPEMIYLMGKFLKKFNGVYLNKLLNIQGRGFKDLPIINEHMGDKNEKCILCYRKVLGFFPGGNCNFRHVAGTKYP